MTDSEFLSVIKCCKGHQRASQYQLHGLLYNYAMTVARRYSGGLEAAEEVTNDAFLKLFTKIDQFQHREGDIQAAFRGWFRRIVVNTAIDRTRMAIHKQETEELLPTNESEEENGLLEKLSFDQIMGLLDRLPPAYRTVFSLFVADGYSHEEIAGLLQISVGASKSNLSRARQHIKKLPLQKKYRLAGAPSLDNRGQLLDTSAGALPTSFSPTLVYHNDMIEKPTPVDEKASSLSWIPETPPITLVEIADFDSIAAVLQLNVDSATTTSVAAQDHAAEIPDGMAPATINPRHNYRWRAGIRLKAGIPHPKEKGVSLLSGQGVFLSYNFFRGLSANFSADFLKYSINADSIPRHFSKIKVPYPDPGHHHDKMTNFSSDQAIQYYSLGLAYPIRLAGALQATISVGHTWAYSPSRTVVFSFEDHNGPGPGPGPHQELEYVVAKTPRSLTSNNYKFGFGLHYELSRWSVGVRGEYINASKQSGEPLNTSIASAEFLYKF